MNAGQRSGAQAWNGVQGLPGGAKGSASTPPKYVEENIKPEDLKPEMGIEDPRMEVSRQHSQDSVEHASLLLSPGSDGGAEGGPGWLPGDDDCPVCGLWDGQENSPSTVGGVIRRYTIKTYEVMRMIPGATVSFAVWATKCVIHLMCHDRGGHPP